MATLTIEAPDDRRTQSLKDFCDSTGISVLNIGDEGDDEDYEYEIAPDSVLWDALKEIEDMKRHPEKYKSYTDIGEMFREILAEPDDDDCEVRD